MAGAGHMLDFASTLPALAPGTRSCRQLTAADPLGRAAAGGAWCGIWDNMPRSELGTTIGHESRNAARACRWASTSVAHSRAQRQVVRCAQVRGHPQLAVDERRDGLGRQVLSGPELPRPDRRVALRGELRGQPGECAGRAAAVRVN